MAFTRIIKISLFFATMFELMGCIPKNHSDSTQPNNPRHQRGDIYEDNLTKKVIELYFNEEENILESCDYKNRAKILEIAKALDENRDKIDKLYKNNEENGTKNQYIQFYKYSFTNDLLSPRTAKDQWELDPPISWNDIISEFENIKTQQINYQWALLNRTFRGVLLDDETRVGFDNVFLIKHDSEELILGIGNKIQQCLDQTSCTKPTLNETEIKFLSPSRHFKFYISIFDDANRSFSDKRKYLSKLYEFIDNNFKSAYTPIKNSLIFTEGTEIKIPVDLTEIKDSAPAFVDFVERFWNIDKNFTVKLITTQRPEPSFLLAISDEIGGRAFVRYSQKLIKFYNYNRLSTIIHEFGHVFGLRDEYYTLWDGNTCSYTDEFNQGSMMSNSATGLVLQKHRKIIKDLYLSN